MIKVTPYSQTLGRPRYKEFLQKPFVMDMLYPVSDNVSIDTIFDGWRGKDMLNWFRFRNDDDVVLEFYPNNTYTIKNGKKEYGLEIPKTIEDFINDMIRYDIPIYWTKWIDENFEPKDYLHQDQIKEYFIDLLAKMGKSHELL